MDMNRKWTILLLLTLGAMIVSGCTPKSTVMVYNDARDAFQRATIAGAKKCAPCQYGTAEAYLALADHEMKYYWREMQDLENHSKIVKDKSLEALSLTPCEKAPAQVPTPAEPPKPTPPPPPEPARPVPPPPPTKPAPVFENVYFYENKTNIDPIAAKALDRNGMILKEDPNIRVEVGGHTDAQGSEVANQKISEKRAESAKKYIMDKFNIAGNRMMVKSYGGKKPIADDKTKEGRAKNRRVEFKVIP